MELKDLKKEYEQLEKRHGLPSFKELNENFEIDKIDKESDTLIRVIRKAISEKLINSMNFLEFLINPINAPRMYMSYLKNISVEDKTNIDSIYSSLAEISLLSLTSEIAYSEKTEAELIKKMNFTWNSQKVKFRTILENIRNPKLISQKKERSYFG